MTVAGDRTVRVRTIDDRRPTLTVKVRTGPMQRDEFEYDLPYCEALKLIRHRIGVVVEKTRYDVAYGGHVWEIDVYEGAHRGLIVAEIVKGRQRRVSTARLAGAGNHRRANVLEPDIGVGRRAWVAALTAPNLGAIADCHCVVMLRIRHHLLLSGLTFSQCLECIVGAGEVDHNGPASLRGDRQRFFLGKIIDEIEIVEGNECAFVSSIPCPLATPVYFSPSTSNTTEIFSPTVIFVGFLE